jgi:hypothetical protein
MNAPEWRGELKQRAPAKDINPNLGLNDFNINPEGRKKYVVQ